MTEADDIIYSQSEIDEEFELEKKLFEAEIKKIEEGSSSSDLNVNLKSSAKDMETETWKDQQEEHQHTTYEKNLHTPVQVEVTSFEEKKNMMEAELIEIEEETRKVDSVDYRCKSITDRLLIVAEHIQESAEHTRDSNKVDLSPRIERIRSLRNSFTAVNNNTETDDLSKILKDNEENIVPVKQETVAG